MAALLNSHSSDKDYIEPLYIHELRDINPQFVKNVKIL